jgi:predicted nucleotidyltransferase
MKIEKDYEELFGLFNKNRVRYCIVGSYAVAFYAKPRYTKDIDALIEPSEENSRRVLRALNQFGFTGLRLREKDFQRKKRIIQLGYEPLRIDLLTGIEGIRFDKIWTNRQSGRYGREKVNFIGLSDLIRLKQKSKRAQDKADLELLLEIRSKK